MMTLKKMVALLLFCFLCGCSAVWEEIGYIPAESEGWNLDEEANLAMAPIAAHYNCGAIEISVLKFSVVKNAFWGPPLIPFLPSMEEKASFLSIEISGGDSKMSCPEIKVNEVLVRGRKRFGEMPWKKSTLLCDYPIVPDKDFYLKIARIGEGVTCPHELLKFEASSRWRYRPFVMPRT